MIPAAGRSVVFVTGNVKKLEEVGSGFRGFLPSFTKLMGDGTG